MVGLGASAGGIEALVAFFTHLPSDSGIAYVVAMHLAAYGVSELPGLLQSHTSMPVSFVEDGERLKADCVFVLPPGQLLLFEGDQLRLRERPYGSAAVTIDYFFRSLAAAHKHRAIAVVLSGAGADGSVGIRRIREEGGVAIAQQPREAKFDDMPRAAIEANAIDFVLPVAEIGPRIVEIWNNAREIKLPPVEGMQPPALASEEVGPMEAEETLQQILKIVRARTRHDFRSYKRGTLLRRLERRLQVTRLPNLKAYREFLQQEPQEAHALMQDFLVGVTNFFRDHEAFQALQKEAIPAIFDQRAADANGVRAWVAGCSTGEEAYSIAILLCEHASQLANAPPIKVFATDIDVHGIARARLATYSEAIEADVSSARLRRFFDKDGNHYRVSKEVREKVMFAEHDILRDPPFSKLDLICCRNLLIYLDRGIHHEVFSTFHFALRPGGYLMLGRSESADLARDLFTQMKAKHRIYRANEVPMRERTLPTLPLQMPGFSAVNADGSVAAPPSRASVYKDLHAKAVEQFKQPGVLIDPEGKILHLSEQAAPFLRYRGGSPSQDLFVAIVPELLMPARMAVFEALRYGESHRPLPTAVKLAGRAVKIRVMAGELRNSGAERIYVFLRFEETDDEIVPDGDSAGFDKRLALQLEDELRRTREQLQATLEQSETSTEELRASNEELQSMNEELRSATEELETSKEELQAVNEELLTVNNELRLNIEDTKKVNDDLHNIIASTGIATVFVDRAMAIKRFTFPATKLFNVIESDVGRSLFDITHKLRYDQLAADAAEAFRTLRPVEREVQSHDGRWYLARALPYRTADDRIEGVVLTFIDISSRRLAEENMRRVMATVDFAVITVDLNGRIVTWNPGAERVWGYTEGEALGQHISLLFLAEDIRDGVVERELLQAREEGRALDDRWHRHKSGKRIYCSGVTTPLYDSGTLKGYGKIARDVTGSKRVEAEREARLREEAARRAEAQAANAMKDEFMAILSHELKNPLNLIQLKADLLARLPEARELPAVRQAAEAIRATVLTQAQIIDDLMDMSRMRTGKLTLHRSSVDLANAVETIVTAMETEARAKRIALSLRIDDRPLHVDADPVRVDQVIWNLVVNALKFTPAGGSVDVRLGVEQHSARLEVSDTGVGIAPEFLPRVFEMFAQAPTVIARRRGGGLGIGMALVKQLAELHGGRVKAASQGIGHGATFTVWLPLAGADGDRLQTGESVESVLRGRSVLLVDDDVKTLEVFQTLLQMEGMRVASFTDASEAFEAAQREHFDMVITDVTMPGLDGYQFLAKLRADESTASIPVIAVTGVGGPERAESAIAAGFDAHMNKPVSVERMLAALNAVLGKADQKDAEGSAQE